AMITSSPRNTVNAFTHRLLPYDGADRFLDGALPFLRDGIAAGDRVVAVCGTGQEMLLRDALGPADAEVEFREPRTWYTHPARTLADCLSAADDAAAGGRRLRVLGEPAWTNRPPPEIVEWQRIEAVAHVAFREAGAALKCPSLASLPARVVAAPAPARRRHAEARQGRPVLAAGLRLRPRPPRRAPRGFGAAPPRRGHRGRHQRDSARRAAHRPAHVAGAGRRRRRPRLRGRRRGPVAARRRVRAPAAASRGHRAGKPVRAVGRAAAVRDGADQDGRRGHRRPAQDGVPRRDGAPPRKRSVRASMRRASKTGTTAYAERTPTNFDGQAMETPWFAKRPVSEVRPGDHGWLAYSGPEERDRVIGPFVREGLQTNEKVVYVTDAPADRLPGLGPRGGVDLDACGRSGQLRVIARRDACLNRRGEFEPAMLVDTIGREVDAAFGEGYRAVRITTDHTWLVDRPGTPDLTRVLGCEDRVGDTVSPSTMAMAICQIDRRACPPGEL